MQHDIIPGHVFVRFLRGTTKDEAFALIAEHDLKLIRFNNGRRLRHALLQVPYGEELRYVGRLSASPIVRSANLSYILHLARPPLY